jgi:glycosyltransferase involved in cell wall biosynthesis
MRVTIVTETFPPQVNGVSRTLGELARRLAERGDAAQVVHPDYGDPPDRPETCRVRSIRLPFYRELRLPLPPFGRVHRAVDAFRPDLIHIATEGFLGLSLLRHAARRSIPIVSSFHTNFDQYSGHYGVGWARPVIGRYLRWFHNRTRETYVPSRTAIARLEAKGFQRLVLWPRGVDCSMFRPDRPGRVAVRADLGWKPEDVAIVCVGRIAPEKNVAFLGDALAIVAERRPGVRILFVGDGPAREELEARLSGRTSFAGYRTGDELADRYAAGDVFAFASKTETFGNVVLEAMASGMPVVALRAGGVADIVRNGETGALLDEAAPPVEFAIGLIHLLDHADERRRMALAARAFAGSQSWDAIMDALRDRYARIIAEAPPPAPPAPTES